MKAESVSLVRNGNTLLDGITCAFPASAVSAVIGPSGSGKTLLLRVLAGRISPTGGTVSPTIAGRIEHYSLYPPESIRFDGSMTLHEYILQNAADTTKESAHRIRSFSRMLSLFALLNTPVSAVCDTILQKALCVAVLSVKSTAYLFDNPLTLMSPEARIEAARIFRFVSTAENVPVIVASADINLALAVSNRYLALKNGGVYSSGQTANIGRELIENLYGISVMFQHNVITGNGECSLYAYV